MSRLMKTDLRHLLSLPVVLLALSLVVSDARAQFGPPGGGRSRGGFGGGGGSAELLRDEVVQKELGLTQEQLDKVEEAQRGMRDNPEIRELFSKMREVSAEERGAVFAEIRNVMERQVAAAISPEQKKRLDELVLQRQGMRALADEDTARSLGLSDDQQDQAKSIIDEYEGKRREVRFNRDLSDEDRDAQLEKLNAERDEKVGAILTPQQKTAFTQKQGRPFDFSGGQSPPSGSAPRSGTPVAGAAPAGPRPTAIETVVPDGAAATVSFGGGALPEGKPVEEMSFNFRYAPWEDVLKLFADASGLTLDLYAIPPGTFNYYDNGKYTPTQALDILNGYLIQKGFILVRRDEFLVVLNIDAGIPPNLVPTVDVAELPNRGRNELLRVVLPLPAGMAPEDAATEVQALLGPQGTAVPLSKTNRLILTDIGSNLQRVNMLLSGLDIEDEEKVFRQFRLANINVLDADTVIRDLFGLGPRGVENVSASASGSSRGFDPRSFFSSRFGSSSRDSSRGSSSSNNAAAADPNAAVKVAIDERTNSLLVTASPQNMRIVEEAVESIDIPEGNGVVNRATREPYLEVYQLRSADAMEVTKTLNVLYPGTVVNEDGRARRIHIQATPEMHREIADTINRLDGQGGGSQVAVIPLGRLDSYTATASIQQLFLVDGDEAPVVQPHPTGNGLIVRGSADQVEQIKLLLTQLDPAQGGGAFGGGNVRQIPLGGRDPEEFLRALQQLWGTSGRNPIRTVVPSAGSGTIKAQKIPALQDRETEAAPRSSDRRENPFRSGSSLGTPQPNSQSRLIAQQMGDEAAARIAVVLEDDLAYQAVEQDDVQTTESESDTPVDDLTAAEQAELEAALDEFLTSSADVEEDDEQPASDNEASDEGSGEADGQSEDDEKPAGNSPIAVTLSGGNLVAVSDDTDALDAFEEAASRLSQAMPPKTQWTVFYLQSADATETSTILERLFPTSSVSSISSSATDGFLGSLSSGLSSLGGGLMNMTGLDSVMTGPQTLRIIPDVRSNSLFVTGPPHQVSEVEEVLRILDASELPEQLNDRSPHYIAVKYAFIGDVAQMIQDVFKEELTPPQPQQQGRGGGQNPLAALMGGGGSGGNSRGNSLQNRVKMTLGVDYQNSRLIVSASEALAREVEAMVADVDLAALESRPTTRIVSLEHSSTAALQQTIGALMPRVKVSSGSSGGSNSGNNNGGSNSPGGAPGGDQAEQMRQMFMQRAMERSRDGGDRGGSSFGGRGSDRGGSPFGSRGGRSPFGSRGGSPFGGRGGR